MSNKAVLPAGKDTIGVRYIEDEGTNIETVIRSTNYVAGTSGYNFALNGSAGTATLDAKDDVTISSNYSVGVSGARIFMDGSAGDISLIATNDVLLDAAYVAGVSGAKLFLDRSLNRIEGSCGDFIASAFNDIYLSSNYSAGVSGAQLFIDGSAGTATLDAKDDVAISSNYSVGVSGARISIFAAGGAVQILGNGASSVFENKPIIYLGNNNPGHVDHLKLAHNNDILISANYVAGVSGSSIFLDGSAGHIISNVAGDFDVSSQNDIDFQANYSAGLSGSRLALDGSAGNINCIGTNDVNLQANYSAGVSGCRIFMDGSAGNVQFLTYNTIINAQGGGASYTATGQSTIQGHTNLNLRACTSELNIEGSSFVDVISGGSGGVRLSPGATAWGVLSDSRHKKNITPLDYGLAQIMALNPVSFNYIEDAEHYGRRIGFIAQEVDTVIPECVNKADAERYIMTKYEIIVTLVKGVQEQQAAIDDLLARVIALETP